ncbi:MAG: 1-phosphofructokinase [Ruminococcus sp.]|nr:1-phosphofructokinase [Ruminococcus sp.]
MIYTVTFNPAVDYVVHVENMKNGSVNRSSCEEIYFGGKGINVSVVLNELGVPSVALGFVAGFTGQAIRDGIENIGIRTDFINLGSGNSRINIKIKSSQETEINGQGPFIDDKALDEFFRKLDMLKDNDILILAGSIPKSLPDDIYERILSRTADKNIRTVVDATNKLLLNTLKYKPFLIKPNNHELGEMFGVNISETDDIVKYARKLHDMGAENVLVSMAEKGALLVDENNQIHICGVCRGNVKNSVGAGDSMVAGFVAGSMNGDYEYALKLGTAAGGATAFSDGLAVKDKIFELLKQL